MTRIFEILLVIAAVQWFNAGANPLFQGISFQRGFELNFKPWPRRGIAFIRENWSPLGVFGKKFAITKRSLDDIMSSEDKPAPVFEHIDEIQHTGPLNIIPKAPVAYAVPSPKPPPLVTPVVPKETPPPPKPVALPIIVNDLPPVPIKLDRVPPISTNMVIIQPSKVVNNHLIPTPTKLYTDISRVERIPTQTKLYTDISRVESIKDHMSVVKPVPEPHLPVVSVPPHVPVVSVPPPPPIVTVPSPPPVKPVPPPPPVVPVPPPPPVIQVTPLPPPPAPVEKVPPPPPPKEPVEAPASHPPVPIKEDIKEEIKEDNKEIQTEIKQEKTGFFSKDGSLVKGSKMALQFGTVFLTLMAQFFDNARASIDLFTNPPPKFM